MEYGKEVFHEGRYLFLQSIYYQLRLDPYLPKDSGQEQLGIDGNAILSDLVYTRILEPSSKRSSYKAAKKFLAAPSYELHDVYQALSVLANNCLIQSEVYKNSNFILKRNDNILYHDCTNYYFEIEQKSGDRKYGKGKEHRPNVLTFPRQSKRADILKTIGTKSSSGFWASKIYLLQLCRISFRGKPVDMEHLSGEDKNELFYKEEPYTTANLHQRLIVTYSPKYAAYQKSIRYYLDEDKIEEEARYDGMYAVCTNLLDDPASDILKVSEGRWQIEECLPYHEDRFYGETCIRKP